MRRWTIMWSTDQAWLCELIQPTLGVYTPRYHFTGERVEERAVEMCEKFNREEEERMCA